MSEEENRDENEEQRRRWREIYGDMVPERIVDTKIGEDGKRYYKVQWAASTCEPAKNFLEAEMLIRKYWDPVEKKLKMPQKRKREERNDSETGCSSSGASETQTKKESAATNDGGTKEDDGDIKENDGDIKENDGDIIENDRDNKTNIDINNENATSADHKDVTSHLTEKPEKETLQYACADTATDIVIVSEEERTVENIVSGKHELNEMNDNDSDAEPSNKKLKKEV